MNNSKPHVAWATMAVGWQSLVDAAVALLHQRKPIAIDVVSSGTTVNEGAWTAQFRTVSLFATNQVHRSRAVTCKILPTSG